MHYIDGQFTGGAATESGPIFDPALGERIAMLPCGTVVEVELAVRAAQRALRSWQHISPAARASKLLAIAAVLDKHLMAFAHLECLQVGKPPSIAREEVIAAIDSLQFFAGAARAALAPSAGEYATGYLSVASREPIGVVGAIAPWNYPLLMAIWKIAPALVAGNTVVLKPSEWTPFTTLLLAGLTADILPPGVLNVVLGSGQEVGSAIAQHPGIDLVSLTGSVETGRSVVRDSVANLKQLHLELGGKAPVVVFPDAPLEAAAQSVADMGYWNAGQECGAATRLLVDERCYDEFVNLLVPRVRRLALGGPSELPEPQVGPLISSTHRARVQALVSRAVADGAEPLFVGEKVPPCGWFYPPTTLSNVSPGAEIEKTEIFGPVVTLQAFKSVEGAIAMSNSTCFGLAASVWTSDLTRAIRLTQELSFGTVWVNTHLTLASEMPWGGFKQSGYGKDQSVYALDGYTRMKHSMISLKGS